ncbi:WFDC2 isoform 2, partial [Pan troglodytes]
TLQVQVNLPVSPLPTYPYSFFYPDKEGSCPQVNINFPQLGLCRDQCQVDSQCPGQMKCCRNGCGKVSCVTPNF